MATKIEPPIAEAMDESPIYHAPDSDDMAALIGWARDVELWASDLRKWLDNRPSVRRSLWGRLWGLIRGNRRLQNQVDTLKFELRQRDREIEDLENRLEAYKDTLVALDRGARLEGMLHQADLDKLIMRKTDARANNT